MSTSIGKQAEQYAEVIVEQIASNFRDLDFTIRNCPDLKKAQKAYDTAQKDGLELKELKDKVDIIKESIGSGFCDDKYNAIEPLAVGLFGEWGSGKTHQLKLIKQRIRRVQDADKKKKRNKTFPKRTIPIFFNAWRFEKEEHIILPLFETLLKEVEAFERPLGEKGKVIVNKLTTKLKVGALALHKGLKAPESFKSVAVDALSGNYGGALMQFFDAGELAEEFTEKANEKLVGEQKIGEMLNPEKLESIYLNITEWIKHITMTEEVNFVFLIDDLDRCLPENTLKMLESIKLFLDVPSCAFVLAVDDDVVERGVVHHYNYASRIVFDLDVVFDKSYDTEKLKLILELQESKLGQVISKNSIHFTDDFYIRLFRGGDVDAWKDVLAEHNATISSEQLEELIEKAKEKKDSKFNNLPFIANPEWVGQIANFVEDEDYITLLKASHDVRFKTNDSLDFEIDMFQMTFAEYDKYCDIRAIEKPKDEGWGRGRRPVLYVSWNNANTYVRWLNLFVGKEYSYALPNKAEWELACNLGKDTKWYFGDDENQLERYAWYSKNSDNRTHPVGKLAKNYLGVYDMHGNVQEWCEDWHNEKTDSKDSKGGSWNGNAGENQIDWSIGGPTDGGNWDVGFRLLRTLP